MPFLRESHSRSVVLGKDMLALSDSGSFPCSLPLTLSQRHLSSVIPNKSLWAAPVCMALWWVLGTPGPAHLLSPLAFLISQGCLLNAC